MLRRNRNHLFSSKRRISILNISVPRVALAFMLTVAWARAQQHDAHYVFNGKTLEVGDRVLAGTARWQVWLYEEATPIPRYSSGLQYSRWGLIEGHSPEDVMRRLKNSQDFEKAYLNFFGAGTWGRYTFANSLGPIAVTGYDLQDQPATPGNLYQLRWLTDRLDKLTATIAPSLENNESDPASPLREYFDQIRDAHQQLCKLSSQMSRTRLEPQFISGGIARAKAEITNMENNVSKIIAVLPTVKLPSTKAWMSHAEKGGSEGTIQVDVTESKSAVFVQRTYTGGDGSMTGTVMVTTIPYNDLGKLDLQAPTQYRDQWTVRIEPAARAFPQTVTSPQRQTARRTFPPVNLATTESTVYFDFATSAEAQDAYNFFLYHQQLGR